MRNFIILISALILFSGNSCKRNRSPQQTDVPLSDANVSASVLVQNLTLPWELVWGADNMLWMTEKRGKVSRVNPTTGQVTDVLTISDAKEMGEGGLLGMALHPSFNTIPHVFVAYNYDRAGTYTEKIVRYTFNGTSLISPVILLDNIAASSIHNGCRLLISADLKLFITTGDASNQPIAQNQTALNGKVLRINLDGTIPADNPNALSPVWSSGHRNPQGLVFANNKLYSSEHGPNNDDEVNIIAKGRNYGWPNVEGACNTASEQTFCAANNVVEPIYKWTPTIAVCGLDYYDNAQIPQWKNSLLMATLKDNTLYQLKLNTSGDIIETVSTYLRGEHGRLRDVCVAPDGKVYISTSNGSGDKILVLKRSN